MIIYRKKTSSNYARFPSFFLFRHENIFTVSHIWYSKIYINKKYNQISVVYIIYKFVKSFWCIEKLSSVIYTSSFFRDAIKYIYVDEHSFEITVFGGFIFFLSKLSFLPKW